MQIEKSYFFYNCFLENFELTLRHRNAIQKHITNNDNVHEIEANLKFILKLGLNAFDKRL
jgi:hypothetical protein